MKALTLHQPWAWSIVSGPKRIENRRWKPWPEIIGQYIALHAGKSYDDAGADYIRSRGIEPPSKGACVQSAIVGVARVVGYLEPCDPIETCPSEQEPWFFGPYGWLLEAVRPLPYPIPCKGALALWQLPADIAMRIEGACD
jgi:hypothetical protein